MKEKEGIIRQNKKFLIEQQSQDPGLTMETMIEAEIALGVIRCNGNNNSSELDKAKKGSWEWTYNSSGRNLVKMWWLTKFFCRLVENLVTKADMSLVDGCQDAYTEGFGSNHSWIVRKGAMLAMMTVGSREAMLAKWELQSAEELRPVLESVTTIRDKLTHILESRSLTDLP